MNKYVLGVLVIVMAFCGFTFGNARVRNLDGEERPFEIFTSVKQLEDYRAAHEGDFFNLADEEYALYGEEFFESNALVMFLTEGMSGSIKCFAEGVRFTDNKLYVTVKELSPSMHTMDLRYNALAVAVPASWAQSIREVRIEPYRVEVR